MLRFGTDPEERKAMKGKRRSAKQIISKLREVEVLLQKGQAVPQV